MDYLGTLTLAWLCVRKTKTIRPAVADNMRHLHQSFRIESVERNDANYAAHVGSINPA
jgi:hypothetical protein